MSDRRHGAGRGLWGAWIALLVGLLAAGARAQSVLPAAGGAPELTPGAWAGHGWVIVPERSPAGATVLHVPPRGVEAGSPDGTLRVAASLTAVPDRVAAQRARLFLMFEAYTPPAFRGHGSPKPRSLYAVGAEQGADRTWESEPPDRLSVMPSISGEGDVLGLAASPASLYCLRRVGTGLVLEKLEGQAWVTVELPMDLPQAADVAVELAGSPTGPGLLARFSGRAVWWSRSGEGAEGEADGGRWTSVKVVLPPTLQGAAGLRVSLTTRSMVVAAGDGTAAYVWALSGDRSGPAEGATPQALDVGGDKGAVGLLTMSAPDASPESDRLVVVRDMPPAGAAADAHAIKVREVSVRTGRVLYDGPARLAPTLGSRDYTLVGATLAMVIGLVLVMVIPAKHTLAVLPERASMAEPGRRVVAWVIDVSAGLGLLSWVTKVGWSEVGSSEWWTSAEGEWHVLLLVGVMICYGTVFEAAFGRTIGKLLTGCEVVDVSLASQAPARRAGIGRVLLRNVLKWALPPVALMGVMDAAGRGRADVLARTAVVSVQPEEDDGLGDDE